MKVYKIMLVLAVLNFVAVLIVTAQLPGSVPVHINQNMIIDRYGSKWILPFFALIPVLVTSIRPLWKGVTSNEKIEKLLIPVLGLFLIGITWMMVYISCQYDTPKGTVMDIPFELIVLLPLGIMIVWISNYMGKIRPNYWLGIRVPWVYMDDMVWKKTHRLGGYTGVAGGLVICLTALTGYFLNNWVVSIGGLLAGIIIIVLVPTVYSCVIYKKMKRGVVK